MTADRPGSPTRRRSGFPDQIPPVAEFGVQGEAGDERDTAHRERFGGVTPHSPSELARLAPDLWPTENAAKDWLRRNKGPPQAEGDPLFGVEYRRPGQRGSAHRATVRLPKTPGPPLPERLRRTLEAVVGPVAAFRVLGNVLDVATTEPGPEPEEDDWNEAPHADPPKFRLIVVASGTRVAMGGGGS